MATFHHDRDSTSPIIRRRKNKPKTLIKSAKLNNIKVVNGTLNDESSNDFVDVTTNDNTLASPVEVSIDLTDLLPDFENLQLESQTTSSVCKEPILNSESDNSHSKFRVTNCDTVEPTSGLRPVFDEGDIGYNSDIEDVRDVPSPRKEHQNADSINVPVCPNDIINLNLVLEKSLKVSCEKLDLELFCKFNRYRQISDQTVCLRPLSPSPEHVVSFEVKPEKKRPLTIRNFFNKSNDGLSPKGLPSIVSTKSQVLNKCATSTRPIVIWPLHPQNQLGSDSNTTTINTNFSNNQPVTRPVFNQNVSTCSNLHFSYNINAPSSDTLIKDPNIEASTSLIDSIASNLDLESLDFSCLENEENMREFLNDLKNLLGVSTDSQETSPPSLRNINGDNLDTSDISFTLPNAAFPQYSDSSCINVLKECNNVNLKNTESSNVSLVNVNTCHPDPSRDCVEPLSPQIHKSVSPVCHNSIVPLTSTPVEKLTPRLIGPSFPTSVPISKSNKVISKCKTQSERTLVIEKNRTLSDIQKEMESFMLSAKPPNPSLPSIKKIAPKTGPGSLILSSKAHTQQHHKPLTSKTTILPKVIENNQSFDFGCSRYNAELDCLFGAGNDFSFSFDDEPLKSDIVVDSPIKVVVERSNGDISRNSDKTSLVDTSKRTLDSSKDKVSDRGDLANISKTVSKKLNKRVLGCSNKTSLGSSSKTVRKHSNKKIPGNSNKNDISNIVTPNCLNRTESKNSCKNIFDYIKKEKDLPPPAEAKNTNSEMTNYVMTPVHQEEKSKDRKKSLKCRLKKSPIMKVKIGSYPQKFKNCKGKPHTKKNYQNFLGKKATKRTNVRNSKKKNINSSTDDTHLNSKNTCENSQLIIAQSKPSIECTGVTFSNSIPSKLFTDFNANSNSEDREKENNNMTGNSFDFRSSEVQDTVEKILEPNKEEVQYFSDPENKFRNFENSKSTVENSSAEAIETIIQKVAGMENSLPLTTLTEKNETRGKTPGMEAFPDTSLSCSPIYPSKEEIAGSNSSLLSTLHLSESDITSDIDQLSNKISQKDAQSVDEDASDLPSLVDDQAISRKAEVKSKENFGEELLSEKECDNKIGETEEKHKNSSDLTQSSIESEVDNLSLQSEKTELNVEMPSDQKTTESDDDSIFRESQEIIGPILTSVMDELEANEDDNQSDDEIQTEEKTNSKIEDTNSSDEQQVNKESSDEMQSDTGEMAKRHGTGNKSIKQIELEQQLKGQSDEKLSSSSTTVSFNTLDNNKKKLTSPNETIASTASLEGKSRKSQKKGKEPDQVKGSNSLNKQSSRVDENCSDNVNHHEVQLKPPDDSPDSFIIVDEINGNGGEVDANKNEKNEPNKHEKPASDLQLKTPSKNIKETVSQSNVISTSSTSKKTRDRTKKHTREKSVDKLKLSCVKKSDDDNQNKDDSSKNWIVSTGSTSKDKNDDSNLDISIDDKIPIEKHVTKTPVVKIERLQGDFYVKPSTPTVPHVSSTAADETPQNRKVPTRTPRNKIKKRPFSPTENVPSPVTSSSHTNSPVIESVPSVPSSQDKKKKKYSEEDVVKPFKFGWMREVVHRASTGKNTTKQSDVYYFNPEGGKLRSMPEISKYLADHKGSGLTIANFTFVKETIYRRPFEQERDAKVKSTMAVGGDASKRKDSPSVKKAGSTAEKRKADIESESLPVKKARLKVTEPKSDSTKGSQVKDSKEIRSKDTPTKDIHSKDVPVKETTIKDYSRSKSKKTVSADSSPIVKNKRESIPTLKVKILKGSPKEKDTSTVTSGSSSVSGGEIEQDLKQILTSPSDIRTDKKINEVRKKARVKYTPPRKTTPCLRNPCTSRCPYALYQNPTISCVECRCLFHPSCIPILPKYGNYTCLACKQELKEKIKYGMIDEICSLETDEHISSNISVAILTPDVSLDTSLTYKKDVASKSSCLSDLPPLPPLKKAPERSIPTPPSVNSNQSHAPIVTTPVTISSVVSGSILQSKLQENVSGIRPLTTFVQSIPASISVSQNVQPLRLVTAVSNPQLPMYVNINDQKLPPQFSFTIPPYSMVSMPERLIPCDKMATPNSVYPVSNLLINQPMLCQQSPIVYVGKSILKNVNQTRTIPSVLSGVGNAKFISINPSLFNINKPVTTVDASSTQIAISKVNNQNTTSSTQQNSEANSKTLEANSKTLEANSKTLEANSKTLEANSKTLEANSKTLEANFKTLEVNSKTSKPNSSTPERRSERSKKRKRYADFESDSDTDRSSDESLDLSSSDSPSESTKAVACVKPQKITVKGGGLNDNVWLHIFNQLSVADWQVAAQVCRSWKTLTSQSCLWKEISFKGISIRDWAKCTEILKRNGTKSLNLRGMHVMNVEETWQTFLKSIENLENIEHLSFDQIPPKVLEAVADALPLLRSLECCCLTATTKRPDLWETPCQLNFTNIRYLRKLRRLKIRSAGGLISQDATSVLQNLPELRYLSLTTVKVSASDHLNFLSSLQKLVSLEFGDCNTWTKENYAALGELKELRHLRLENGGDFRDNNLPEALKHLENLEELQLMNFRIPRRLGDALGTLGHIRKLSLWPDMSKQMAEVNYNAFQCAVQAKSVKYFCWGIISADDSIPLLQFLKDPSAQPGEADNVEELDYEDLFEKLLEVIPDDAKAEIKCISQTFFKEYCCKQL